MTMDPGAPGTPMSDRMQSLLSRAAEDQLAEQRQLAGALTELRAQLQHIAGDVASLRESSGGGGGSAEAALASVSGDIRDAVRLLAERLDGVARLVQQRGSDLAELNAATSALQSAVRGHGEALAGVGSGLAALPSFGDRIGGLQDNLDALHQRLAGLEELGTTIGALQQRVDAVDHGLRELRSAFAAIGARMAELPGRADLDASASRSAAPLAAVSERFEALEKAVAALPEALSGLATPAAADPGLERIDARLEQMASTQREVTAATRDRLTALEGQLADVLTALTPEEEEAAEDADAYEVEEPEMEDPVLAELAELREALLGEGGIVERLEADDADEVDAKVASAVERAVSASEERLSEHIDEAVLALADALLRRRPGRGGRAVAAAAPLPTMAGAQLGEAATDDADSDDNDSDDNDSDDTESDDTDSDDTGSEDSAADHSGPPWQTPSSGAASRPDGLDAAASGEPADADRRRRPWWRPGD